MAQTSIDYATRKKETRVKTKSNVIKEDKAVACVQ